MTAAVTQQEMQIQWEIERFLSLEAELMDSNRHAEWLELLHEDFLYRMPVPVTREEPSQDRYDPVLEFANESKSFLSMRFGRIASDFAWAERPAAFVRHFVTNVRVRPLEADSFQVRSNVLVSRSRRPEPLVLGSAERVDRIDRVGGRLLLARRVVLLDTEAPTDGQLSVIY